MTAAALVTAWCAWRRRGATSTHHAHSGRNVPERPTEIDARDALLRIRRFFQTFPFGDGSRVKGVDGIEVTDFATDAGLDENIFVAALLTGVCRQSLELAPGLSL